MPNRMSRPEKADFGKMRANNEDVEHAGHEYGANERDKFVRGTPMEDAVAALQLPKNKPR